MKLEQIIRQRRKTISLEVTPHATLVVKVPYYLTDNDVRAAVKRHMLWIERRLKNIEAAPSFKEKKFVSGESFLYLGRSYRLLIVKEQKEALKFDNNFYLVEGKRQKAKEIFVNWYKRAAKDFVLKRVNMYTNKIGVEYESVKINSAKKRWGSCSHSGNLNFSYRLIMAPVSVVDYVVVHELCHILEHNHSKRFWRNVKVVLPHYEKNKLWLKENSYLLNI
ncbi:MAG: DUF45 domain-containing protein [Nitrospiraceae bacterium]|nr:DUF45 domain-containing protein [Nitrospiraceae bacterium]